VEHPRLKLQPFLFSAQGNPVQPTLRLMSFLHLYLAFASMTLLAKDGKQNAAEWIWRLNYSQEALPQVNAKTF
jgi:hypothetical protein